MVIDQCHTLSKRYDAEAVFSVLKKNLEDVSNKWSPSLTLIYVNAWINLNEVMFTSEEVAITKQLNITVVPLWSLELSQPSTTIWLYVWVNMNGSQLYGHRLVKCNALFFHPIEDYMSRAAWSSPSYKMQWYQQSVSWWGVLTRWPGAVSKKRSFYIISQSHLAANEPPLTDTSHIAGVCLIGGMLGQEKV